MSFPLQSTRPTTTPAAYFPIPSNQGYNPFIDFKISLSNSDSFSLENRVSNGSLKENETSTSTPDKMPSVVRPIPIRQALTPYLATVVSDFGTVNSASPSLLPSTQEFMVSSADSAPSLEKRVSKRSREESETPSSSPFKRPRTEQQPMVPVSTSQLPTATFGDVSSAVPRYSGNYKDGLYHGLGTLISANGDIIYTGNFRYGVYHGHGNLTYQNGGSYGSYTGEFRRGVYHGDGVLTSPDGTIYGGRFQNGAFHGKGVFQRGNFYASGEFQNNLIHGEGTVVIKDILTYFGRLSNGLYHGKGLLINYLRGETYDGEFNNNFYHGYGQLTFANGMPPQIGVFRLGIFQQQN